MQFNQFKVVKCNPINLNLTPQAQSEFKKMRLSWIWIE